MDLEGNYILGIGTNYLSKVLKDNVYVTELVRTRPYFTDLDIANFTLNRNIYLSKEEFYYNSINFRLDMIGRYQFSLCCCVMKVAC